MSSVAQALHKKGIPNVIASRYPLSVRGSIAMVKAVYGKLLDQAWSLERSLRHARAALFLPDERGVDDERDQLVAVSPDGHVSTPWADAGRQAAIEPTTVFVDPATSKAWTVDRLNLGVIEIDLATGEQTVLSRDRQSSSTRLFHGRDVVLDAAAGRLIVSSAATSDGDWRSALMSISLADGARSGLSSGAGRSFAFLPWTSIRRRGRCGLSTAMNLPRTAISRSWPRWTWPA